MESRSWSSARIVECWTSAGRTACARSARRSSWSRATERAARPRWGHGAGFEAPAGHEASIGDAQQKGSVMTAYQFAKVVNAGLKEAGFDKVLPPQMFYTYYKKGFIKEDARNQAGAEAWVAKYIKKHEATLEKA